MKSNEVFYYADEFNLSWLPTLRSLWSPKGQQVMIPTPLHHRTHFGIGGVNYHTGETVVIVRPHKRRIEMAEFLRLLLKKHPDQTIYIAWDNANTHQGGDVEQVLQEAAGKLVLLYLPTYSLWLNRLRCSGDTVVVKSRPVSFLLQCKL